MQYIYKANILAPFGTLSFAASILGLFCLPMSNRKGARFIWVNNFHLTSFLLDIVKKNRPRCDAAKRGVPSGAILFAYTNLN